MTKYFSFSTQLLGYFISALDFVKQNAKFEF